MSWTEPKYSKKAVGRSGDALINSSSEEEYAQALIIVNNWRAAHACPLNSLQSSLRYRAQKISQDVLISQRLKRVPSIKGKLQRSQGMQLDRMQDIGGCRATFPAVEDVYALKDMMKIKPPRSLLSKEYDYIQTPKPSGYRGIHLVYKFQGKKHSVHNGLLIEV
ncbi:RelA/SpoT domain-containing protein [Leptolyngbya sp. GB1-A1]|uniref:RelA/SpoT domain-containing protein n=1 Tax=Leptolyngbya sp. GB1-A1 TaxID=2933908 RepID=UPI00329A0460